MFVGLYVFSVSKVYFVIEPCKYMCVRSVSGNDSFVTHSLTSPHFFSTSKSDRIHMKESVIFPIFDKKGEIINLIVAIKHSRHRQKILPVHPQNYLIFPEGSYCLSNLTSGTDI